MTRYTFFLYLNSLDPQKREILRQIQTAFKDEMQGRFLLEIIDLSQSPSLSLGQTIESYHRHKSLFPASVRSLFKELNTDNRSIVGSNLLVNV